jgi:predicted enzyme related to lactoylglutathione lyase
LRAKFAIVGKADVGVTIRRRTTLLVGSGAQARSTADEEMTIMQNALNWFEIPVRDMDRAVHCYETLLGSKLRREDFGGMPYGIFPYEEPGVSGALVQDAKRTPGAATVVYLDADGKLDEVLSRVESANASVLLPKTEVGKDGFIAIIVDSEGNHVGFNSST